MSGCTSSGSAENGRPRFRVAEVLRQHGPALLARGGLSTQQRKALRDAQRCRTAALGGHIDACSACGHRRPSYNSCRNRQCPSCQGQRQQQWVQARMERVLPVRHFHVVFTVPAQLRGLWQCNPERLHALLFEAARVTLTTLAKQRLGAVLGVTAVLHTWTRELHYHPHLHCVVTAGGLDLRRKRWVPTHPRYLFPVALLGKLFRGVLLRRLEAAFANGELRCVGRATGLADPGAKDRLLRQLRRIKWVVYAKQPFAGAEQVFRYLGRYTHRVAISDRRLLAVEAESICIATRNGGSAWMTSAQFVARLLLHVLPRGLHKIRHFGLYAPTHASRGLPLAARLLAPRTDGDTAAEHPNEQPRNDQDAQQRAIPEPPASCERCGSATVRLPVPRLAPARVRGPPRSGVR